MKEDIRTVENPIAGRCMDCGKMLCGDLGVRFIESPQGPGIEVCVCVDGEAHPLARIQREFIPTVRLPALHWRS